MLNPSTVLSFMIAFTAFGINTNPGSLQSLGLILGILVGTMCWWLTLTGIVVWFRDKVTDLIYIWLNRILGILMMLLGIVMMISGVNIFS